MEKNNIIYAAYGSNMNLRQMARRCHSAKVIGVGVLENYKLTFRGIQRGVANIEKCKGTSIPVVLWKITSKCEKALDYYEGYPKLYLKESVQVKFKNRIIDAMVYIMSKDYSTISAKPSAYYIETIEQGYKDNGLIIDGLYSAIQEVRKELIIKRYA